MNEKKGAFRRGIDPGRPAQSVEQKPEAYYNRPAAIPSTPQRKGDDKEVFFRNAVLRERFIAL